MDERKEHKDLERCAGIMRDAGIDSVKDLENVLRLARLWKQHEASMKLLIDIARRIEKSQLCRCELPDFVCLKHAARAALPQETS